LILAEWPAEEKPELITDYAVSEEVLIVEYEREDEESYAEVEAVIEEDSISAEVEAEITVVHIDTAKSLVFETDVQDVKQDKIHIPSDFFEAHNRPELLEVIDADYNDIREDNIIPVASFIASPSSGCNNLHVKFINTSEYGSNFRWSFGDGGFSSEEHPSYFYDKPEIYNVELEIASESGTKDRIRQTVDVYRNPEAFFEINTDEESGYGRTVYFYNYSRDAEQFVWDFGDGNQSTDKNPTHIYFDEGNFDINLMVTSPDGCVDNMLLRNIFSDDTYYINFPNAFRPDRGGPSDGSYDPAEPVTKVFFPQYKGVAEFQLTIYDKSGRLIFETSILERGWDGYFNNQLVPFGVYIWKVRGRFENGKPFVKGGDVTVILNR
jgi:PKD repeat protein